LTLEKEGLGNKIIHFIPLTTILHFFIHLWDKKPAFVVSYFEPLSGRLFTPDVQPFADLI
jgi:hypothetical protein